MYIEGYIAREKEVARSLLRENVKATKATPAIQTDSLRRWSASCKFQWRYWFCDCCWLEGEALDCCWAGCCDAVPPCWDVALPSLRVRELPPSWLLPRPAREPAAPVPGAPDDCRTIARILLCADCESENKRKYKSIYFICRVLTIVETNVEVLLTVTRVIPEQRRKGQLFGRLLLHRQKEM